MKTYFIRYSTPFYTRALYGVYSDHDAAVAAATAFIQRCLDLGQPAVARSVEIC